MQKLLNTYMRDKTNEELFDLLNNISKEKINCCRIKYSFANKQKDCTNNRGIILTSISGNTPARILEKTLREKLEITLENTKHGFRKGRNRQDIIFIISF